MSTSNQSAAKVAPVDYSPEDPWADSADKVWEDIDQKTESAGPSRAISLLPHVANPELIFVEGGTKSLVDSIREIGRRKADGLDASTPRGRAALKSIAYEITRTSTGIDNAGKTYVAKIKELPKAIDAERKWCRDRLKEFHDEIRKPLTDWEDADKARIKTHYDALEELSRIHQVRDGETSDTCTAKLEQVAKLRARDWQEFVGPATSNLDEVETALKERRNRFLVAEAEALELARLRKAEQERAQKERDERIAQEAKERAEKAAEAKAKREQEERDAAAQRALDAEREKTAKAEREKQAAEQRAIDADAKRVADAERHEQEKRDAAAEQPRAIPSPSRQTGMSFSGSTGSANVRKAVDAVATILGDRPMARRLIDAVGRGEIPHVKIEY
jgi:hypothetical protein